MASPQRRLELRQVYRAIDTLPEALRVPLCLAVFEDSSMEEISQVLGLTVSAVKVRIHRARKKLAEMLGEAFEVRS
jgi:RNA polymerase sigma-70 factor (ECF subfamily)